MSTVQEKGSISIHTENIFPIIKKFLYSDHEIFLRELVSNAVDATQKLKKLSSMGEFQGELAAGGIQPVVLVAFRGEGVQGSRDLPMGCGKGGKRVGGHLRRGKREKVSGGVLGHWRQDSDWRAGGQRNMR